MENNVIKNFFQAKQPKILFISGGITLLVLLSFGIWKYSDDNVPVDLATEALNLEIDQQLPTESATGASEAVAMAPANAAEVKAVEERKEIVKKQIKESRFVSAIKQGDQGVELDCEAILKEYEKEIELSLKSKQISEKLLDSANDLLLLKCQSDPEFEKRFMAIYNKLDNI